MEKYKIYDRDFKLDAIRLALEKNRFKAAKELGVAPSNIYRWQKELQKYGNDSFCGKNNFRNPEERTFSELKRTLKKKLKESELQIEIYRKASKHIAAGKPMIFHFIEDNLDKYPLWKMCEALNIRTGTYHRWKSNIKSPRQLQTSLLEEEIASIFHEYKGIYGNGKIAAELQSRGFELKLGQVTSYMRKLGLTSKVSRKPKSGSNSLYNPCIFPNILNRQFTAEKPSQVWVSGITSLEVKEGLLFLTVIMDLFDRKIIGYSVSSGLTIKETAIPAWEMATNTRKIGNGLLFHSDRGPQYANKLFTSKLNSYKCIRRSMSRQGNRLDNAIPRDFFNAIKSELAHSGTLLTKKQIGEKVSEIIEGRHQGQAVLLQVANVQL